MQLSRWPPYVCGGAAADIIFAGSPSLSPSRLEEEGRLELGRARFQSRLARSVHVYPRRRRRAVTDALCATATSEARQGEGERGKVR